MCAIERRVAAQGTRLVVLWAIVGGEKSPAREFFGELPAAKQAQMAALFNQLAQEGKIWNRDRFRQLGDQAKGRAKSFWEFKAHQTRFIGEYRPGGVFVIALGVTKKKDDLKPSDIAKATRILDEYQL